MNRIITVFALVLLLTSCRKMCCTNVYAHVFLKYENSNGDDLLDPKTPNALTEQDIEVYVLRKGTRVRLFNAMMDAPKNFKIRGSSTEKYTMQFYFDIAEESFVGNKVTMFIAYRDGSEDKLVGEFNESEGSNIILQNVWINGIAKGIKSSEPSGAFIIKK